MQKASRTAAGIELQAVAANSTAEVGDAALALIANGVDAICQIPGNLTASAFPSIAQAARQARMPVFAFQSSQVTPAPCWRVSRDYYDSGREAAALAARVMRGESPATIPFERFAADEADRQPSTRRSAARAHVAADHRRTRRRGHRTIDRAWKSRSS